MNTTKYPGTCKATSSKKKRLQIVKNMNNEIEDFFKRTKTSHKSTNMLSRHDLACFKTTSRDTMNRLKEKFAHKNAQQRAVRAVKQQSSIERLNISMEQFYKKNH